MKFSIPPAGSVSPCVRMFLESLIREVEDLSVPGLFEAESGEPSRGVFAALKETKPVSPAL
jgi:hypothetical protein